MLSNETIERIWHCRREIEAGNKLINDMEEIRKRDEERNMQRPSKLEPTLKDAFGQRRDIELGIPCGESGHRLFRVSPLLAESVIRGHIANKTAELAEATEQARIELCSCGA